MEIKLDPSKEFIANLALQRTGPLLAMGGGEALKQWVETGSKKGILLFLQADDNLQKFLNLVFSEINKESNLFHKTILPRLQKQNKIVSIGPGNCIFELFLINNIKDNGEILLIDVEDTPGLHKHLFEDEGSGYANLGESQNFLRNNGVSWQISLCNPRKTPLPNADFTLLYSILSMGFHYPLESYLKYILTQSQKDSLVIFDCRKGYNQPELKKLESCFKLFHKEESIKSVRLFLQRK